MGRPGHPANTGRGQGADVGETVLIGLGANLGEPIVQLRAAVQALRAMLDEVVVSSVYRTAPVGYASQPDFMNLVCRGRTGLAADRLLEETQRIERSLGREPSFRNAPRTIDVDILAVGERVVDSPGLVVPHPRLHLRGFVLVPLREVAPEWRHPLLRMTPAEMIDAAGPTERVERVGPLFEH